MTFSELVDIAKCLPIKEVLERNGVSFRGQGVNLQSQSPFRPNSKIDSFNINTTKNIFHDWNLDFCGGPIKFYQLYFNLDFKEAVKKLAEDFGLGTFNGRISKDVERMLVHPSEQAKPKPLDLKLISTVYNVFLDMITLSDEDKAYLQGRNLTDEEISILKFKTFPRRSISFRKSFEEEIKKIYGNVDVLFDVPGFFRKKGELFNFPRYNGIIIPCIDKDGLTVGLQIRRREEVDHNKYIWFSSSFCLKDNSFEAEKDGIGPGAPVGVKYTKKSNADTLFITEGFFKANKLEKTFHRPVVIIQGIGNWRTGVIDTIGKVLKTYPTINRIIIAYDADMCYNANVVRQADAMGTEIVKKFKLPIQVLMWDVSKGKGIDDLIEGNPDYAKYIKTVDIMAFHKSAQEMLPQIKRDSTKDEIRVIFDKSFAYIL
jgi:hypothetical protein